ncbi:MAG TPA: hypothetical protein PK093_12010, partial [Phycisphaerae bacterium]|nr:hypothetical protein [Phycisphaerae bacterium]
ATSRFADHRDPTPEGGGPLNQSSDRAGAVPSHARQQVAWRPIAASRNLIQLGASMRAIGASLVDSDTRDMFGSARPTP